MTQVINVEIYNNMKQNKEIIVGNSLNKIKC